ncbi:hypothetical protein TWF192_010465 [Orbilia oligospora]|uniref:Uncharacterized protein n=1 Tax=Orbilia oligospora TaxID=2813651 RepID=A0A6G1MHZ1_ORBOL|nr:hypothetical protein TWF191_006532 [Orbilia oligospora]KAF3259608.1 hypothetical protein TWF192_010465 [Orbilia oligospora]
MVLRVPPSCMPYLVPLQAWVGTTPISNFFHPPYGNERMGKQANGDAMPKIPGIKGGKRNVLPSTGTLTFCVRDASSRAAAKRVKNQEPAMFLPSGSQAASEREKGTPLDVSPWYPSPPGRMGNF